METTAWKTVGSSELQVQLPLEPKDIVKLLENEIDRYHNLDGATESFYDDLI